MKVGIYVRDSDGQVKVRRLVMGQTYDPVPGYTFKGEVDETALPPRDHKRNAWVYGSKRVNVDTAKAAAIESARSK